ncbi:hypothetical protein ACFFRR_010614 [Megaselia abdita]
MYKDIIFLSIAYKRVAWPPASEHRPAVREFTPQPQQFSQQPSQGVHFNQTQTPNTQTPQSHYYQQPPPQTPPKPQQQPPYAQQHHNQFSNNPSGPTNTFSNPQVHNQKEHVVPIVVEGGQNQNQNMLTPNPNTAVDHNNRWHHVKSPSACRSGYVFNNQSQQQPQQQYSTVPQSTGSWQGQTTTAPAYAPTYQSNAGVVNPSQSQPSSSTGYYQAHDNQQPQQQHYNYYNPSSSDQVDYNRQQYRHCSQPPPQSSHSVVDNHNQQYQSNYSQAYRGESPGVIQLRKEAPFNQRPSPVYQAQPAATTYQGGANMRGDMRWPPPEYKEQAAAANEERRRIAAGPICRPRRVAKDYAQFFAKNQINNYYPGYRVPPGTQHVN